VWTTVLVDDDANVLRGMKKAIPWDEIGAECIGESSDGLQGLRLVQNLRPDIVLTDIYMPVMSGLDMIERLRQEGYAGKIVILSGYSDFQYARQALRLNVDDYLSKPITIRTIKEAFAKVIDQLEAERAGKQERLRLEERLEQYERDTGGPSPLAGHIRFVQELVEALKYQQLEQASRIVADYRQQLNAAGVLIADPFLLGMELWGVLTFALYDVGIKLDEMFPQLELKRELAGMADIDALMDWLANKAEAICGDGQWDENLKHRQAVDFMIRYIHDNYADNITLNHLANELYISRYYLGQIFKKATGDSFNQYLTKVRIAKAKELLLEGKFMVYEITEKVGFRNVPYFSTLFKKYTGMNPTDLVK